MTPAQAHPTEARGESSGAASGESVHDEVDRVVAAWARERGDLDLSPLEVLSRITRVARHLDRHRRTAFAGHELETWEFDVLAALRRAGEPYRLSPGQLAAETMVTSGTMTNRIDRLAARDLVRRGPDPDDGRGVLVWLTSPGRERVDAAMAALLSQEHRLLAGLDDAQRGELAGLLRELALQLDA